MRAGLTRLSFYMNGSDMLAPGVFDDVGCGSSAALVMLSRTIIDEIFNLRYRVNDIALEHVYDELARHGCQVCNTIDCDASVLVYFQRPLDARHPLLDGELRINRIDKQFEITVRYGDETILPAFGSWELVDEYLGKVLGN